MKSFEYTGEWWTSDYPEKRVRGMLSFSGKEGLHLRLEGHFGVWTPGRIEVGERKKVPIVWGTTREGKDITLVQLHGLVLLNELYCVSTAYVGAHLDAQEADHVREIYVSYEYLAQWATISGLRHVLTFDSNGLETCDITYVRPEKKIAELPDLGVSVYLDHDLVWSHGTHEWPLRQKTRFHVIAVESLSLDEWLTRYIAPLQDLLSLATLRPNSITEMWCYVRHLGRTQEHSVRVDVLFHPIFHREQESPPIIPEAVLFMLQDVEDYFQEMIGNWLHARPELTKVWDLFFSVYYDESMYLDAQFIKVVQAVEVYHRSRFDKKNKSRLGERIVSLLQNTDDIIGDVVHDTEAFARIVTNTRNYLTHHPPTLKDKAANQEDLFWLTEVLSIMMQRCFLKELGIPSERCLQMFHRNQQYIRVKMRTSQFPW